MTLTLVLACVFGAILVQTFVAFGAHHCACVVTGAFVRANGILAVLVKTLATTFYGTDMLANMVTLALILASVFRASLVCAFSTSRAFAGTLVCGRRRFVTGTFFRANGILAVLVETLAAHGAYMLALVCRRGRIGVARHEHGANHANSQYNQN